MQGVSQYKSVEIRRRVRDETDLTGDKETHEFLVEDEEVQRQQEVRDFEGDVKVGVRLATREEEGT